MIRQFSGLFRYAFRQFCKISGSGFWNLTFSANGFRDTTISNVVVVNRQRTDLIVDMSPVVDGIETLYSPGSVLLYPNPARIAIKALLPDSGSGLIQCPDYRSDREIDGRL